MYIADHYIQSHLTDEEGRTRRAFTLIEIIVVVVILAIAALIAIPVFSGASEIQLKAAADKLGADIEYAKSMAVTTQKNHKVVFDTNLERYEIQVYNSLTSTWTLIKDPVRNADFRVTYSSPGSRLSSVGIKIVTFGDLTLQFDYTGTPREGANYPGTALTAIGEVTLEAKGQECKVKVEPVTGYITIE
jgi:prepilin-type N-terminal cleavage/methylation domain-containing protein